MNRSRVGMVGCGNLAKAVLAGVLDKQVLDASQIIAYDVKTETLLQVTQVTGISAAKSIRDLCEKADFILLAVKPDTVQSVFHEAGDAIANKAVLSVAAGVSTEQLQSYSTDIRILRIMPNTPVMVGEGVSAFCSDKLDSNFTDDEKALAETIFSAIGKVCWVEEKLLDAVTGLSGSGPAYVFMMIEALADGGVREGLPRALAYELAAQTLLGSAKMALTTHKHPGELKDMVMSPGGTTAAGVYALEASGLRVALMNAVHDACEKSKCMKHK